MKKLLLLTGVPLLLQSPATLAGTLMEYYATPSFEDGRGDLDIHIGGPHVLFSGKAQNGEAFKVMYDNEVPGFTVANGAEQTFKRYPLKTFNSIHRIRAEYHADLEKKLAETNSEAKRQAYREFTKGLEESNLGGEAGTAPVYESTGETKSLGGLECTVFEVLNTEGEVDRVLCMADVAQSQLPESDRQLIEKMSETAVRIVTAVDWAVYALPRIALDFKEGLPLEIEYLREEEESFTLTLADIAAAETGEELFRIPDGYTEIPVQYRRQ